MFRRCSSTSGGRQGKLRHGERRVDELGRQAGDRNVVLVCHEEAVHATANTGRCWKEVVWREVVFLRMTWLTLAGAPTAGCRGHRRDNVLTESVLPDGVGVHKFKTEHSVPKKYQLFLVEIPQQDWPVRHPGGSAAAASAGSTAGRWGRVNGHCSTRLCRGRRYTALV